MHAAEHPIGTLSPKTYSRPGGRQEIRTLLLICGTSIVCFLLEEFGPLSIATSLFANDECETALIKTLKSFKRTTYNLGDG